MKTPGIQEFVSLFNAYPDPALILDRSQEMIVYANSALIRLTAFPQNELTSIRITKLIQEPNLGTTFDGEEKSSLLNRFQRDPIPIRMRMHVLDHNRDWYLLSFRQEEPAEENASSDQSLLYERLIELSHFSEAQSPTIFLGKALNLAKEILKVNYLCIYQAGSDYPRLIKIAANETEDIFPETIPSTDLIRLPITTLWQPGKRVLTDIHRSGRMANLSYVASTALGNDGALFGLFVVGGQNQKPGEKLENLLNIFGVFISNTMQRFVLEENLKKDIAGQEMDLNLLKSFSENTQEGLFILFPDLKIREINPAAELMLGYTTREVSGQPVENVLISPEGFYQMLITASTGIGVHDAGDVTLHKRNGQSFPAHMQVLPIYNHEEIQAVLVFMTDVSETEQIRIRTQQLEQRAFLGEFLAIFAHEVRNPINNISTGIQLMASRIKPGDPNLDVINRIQGDCTRLNHLMESILAYSRPLDSKMESVDLGVLLTRILDRWRPRLLRLNIIPYYQSVEKLPKIHGDPRSLEQVFINLINNAMDAMSKNGGLLAIRLALCDEIKNRPQIEITISDNGPGIPDEIKDRIFEPFVTNNPKGTGLGLAITKRIITAHQGSIRLTTFPGGTVFHIYLPATHGDA